MNNQDQPNQSNHREDESQHASSKAKLAEKLRKFRLYITKLLTDAHNRFSYQIRLLMYFILYLHTIYILPSTETFEAIPAEILPYYGIFKLISLLIVGISSVCIPSHVVIIRAIYHSMTSYFPDFMSNNEFAGFISAMLQTPDDILGTYFRNAPFIIVAMIATLMSLSVIFLPQVRMYAGLIQNTITYVKPLVSSFFYTERPTIRSTLGNDRNPNLAIHDNLRTEIPIITNVHIADIEKEQDSSLDMLRNKKRLGNIVKNYEPMVIKYQQEHEVNTHNYYSSITRINKLVHLAKQLYEDTFSFTTCLKTRTQKNLQDDAILKQVYEHLKTLQHQDLQITKTYINKVLTDERDNFKHLSLLLFRTQVQSTEAKRMFNNMKRFNQFYYSYENTMLRNIQKAELESCIDQFTKDILLYNTYFDNEFYTWISVTQEVSEIYNRFKLVRESNAEFTIPLPVFDELLILNQSYIQSSISINTFTVLKQIDDALKLANNDTIISFEKKRSNSDYKSKPDEDFKEDEIISVKIISSVTKIVESPETHFVRNEKDNPDKEPIIDFTEFVEDNTQCRKKIHKFGTETKKAKQKSPIQRNTAPSKGKRTNDNSYVNRSNHRRRSNTRSQRNVDQSVE